MAQFYVDASSLRTKVSELQQLNNSFKSEMDNLQETEQILAGMWEGSAKDAFRTAFNSDIVQMSNFYNAINTFADRLQEIVVQYERAESTNTQLASTRTYGG